ncbi:MAG: iron ABC transporter permease [Candidatus Symbiopectobacterium sp. PLON1]|nr:iron ABC transporter permease [Candidatus Symbiopectobacterium sp. PLON1]
MAAGDAALSAAYDDSGLWCSDAEPADRAAWVMAYYRFPGKRDVAWTLCLPLAMPAFLIADFYADMLGQHGVLWALLDFPALSEESAHSRTLLGACVLLALAFYPYVYLPVRHALESQPPHWLQAAQLLKLTPRQVFWRLSFPLVRPVIGMGAMLVAIETLNDYGTALAGTAYADNAFDRCWRVAR